MTVQSRRVRRHKQEFKLDTDLDRLKIYIYTEDKVFGSVHSYVTAWTEKKYENRSQEVKCHQFSATSSVHAPCDVFLASYINFGQAVFKIFCGQTDGHTHAHTDAGKNNTCFQHSWRAVNKTLRYIMQFADGI